MKKLLVALALGLALQASASTPRPTEIPVVQLDGKPFDNARLAGKVVLYVNVASHCGYTRQYAGLEKLYETYKDRGLVLVGVPCNQFGGQEPGSPEEIQSFCQLNYGVTFPLLQKQDVNGAARSPLYQSLVSSPAGGGKDVQWNFEKFLIGRDGTVRARFLSAVTPEDPTLVAAVEAALAEGAPAAGH